MRNFSLIFWIFLFLLGFSNYIFGQEDNVSFQVQKILKELGYDPGTLDGIWGKKTEKALIKFQKDNGLPETGKLDSITKEKLLSHEVGKEEMSKVTEIVNDYLLLYTFVWNWNNGVLSPQEAPGQLARKITREILRKYSVSSDDLKGGFMMPSGMPMRVKNGLAIIPEFSDNWIDLLEIIFYSSGKFPPIHFRHGGYDVIYENGDYKVQLTDGTEVKMDEKVWVSNNNKWVKQ